MAENSDTSCLCLTAYVPDLANVSSRNCLIVKSKRCLSTIVLNKSMYCLQDVAGYSASAAVAKAHLPDDLPTPHGRCSCCPSHSHEGEFKQSVDARSLVYLSLLPPSIQAANTTSWNEKYQSMKFLLLVCLTSNASKGHS